MSIELGLLQKVEARAIWEYEAGHFTPWLAENLSLLGSALGLDLELSGTEAAVGPFSADIVARDTGRDRKVIIENQLERTDHTHLGQLLTYAAGLDATIVVWISPEIREEHRAALDWLNRHTSAEIEFFGVVLEVIRIDDSKPAIVFRLAASPNSWTTTVSSVARSAASPKAEAYRTFFQPVVDELREKHKFTNTRTAPREPYFWVNSIVAGIWYGAAFRKGDRLRAELYIGLAEAARNKAIYDAFLISKRDIEATTGQLVWERLDGRKECKISLERSSTRIEDAADHGEEMRVWLVQALLEIKATFEPRLTTAAQVADKDLQQETVDPDAPSLL